MGLTSGDLNQLTVSYRKNMEALRAATLDAGKFSWQMLWTGGAPNNIGSTLPVPLVRKASCAADLRQMCAVNSTAQTRAMMYAFSVLNGDPAKLPDFKADLANFLLVRGAYAWLGHGWKGCSRSYTFPPELNFDYGEPTGLCEETPEHSGVFTREWTKASVQMDCSSWTPTIVVK